MSGRRWLVSRSVEPLSRISILAAIAVSTCLWLSAPVPATDASATSPVSSDSLAHIVLATPGSHYSIVSQGVHDPSTFTPDPAGAADALVTPGGQIEAGSHVEPYERTWSDAAGTNRVDDLLVRFPTRATATAFLGAVRHSLDTPGIVSSAPLPEVPGARRVTYLASTAQGGFGQAVTMRAGIYVDVLSFVSSASGNDHPVTSTATEQIARAQYAAMDAAPGGKDPVLPKGGTSWSGVVWAVLAVIVLAGAAATPLLLRRRSADEPASTGSIR